MRISCHIPNHSGFPWHAPDTAIGWQLFDPDTHLFIAEGQWLPLPNPVPPGASATLDIDIDLPPEDAAYSIYLSPISHQHGWLYMLGHPFQLLAVQVSSGAATLTSSRLTTRTQLRLRALLPALSHLLTAPFLTLLRHKQLIFSMTSREILSRYRGSFGDVAWTILHPLLLMATYFFVFGVVLQSRFGNDPSRTSFALYFLAGMLPWLAFNEPLARAPHIILEHRNFVKKLVFPVAILPVNPVFAALVTSLLATALYLPAAYIAKDILPPTAALLPLVIAPQLLLTLGCCWFLSALGVFFRDLTQIMGFVLTIWFFITPICYPESSLPTPLLPYLSLNPMFQIVHIYRQILLESTPPSPTVLLRLWLVALTVFFTGHAIFRRLRRTFPDLL